MRITKAVLPVFFALALASCNETLDSAVPVDLSKVKNKVEHPLSERIIADMKAKGMERNAPIMIRIFKEEGALEIWKAKTDNRFDRIASYEICAWSGKLGPKVKEGDRQAPEGFYNLTPGHLNPNSSYYLAINTGFPNRYDQANGRNGSNLMIHGACSSSGCYSMTDEQVLEIYAFARDAFKGGQKSVQLQAFPFRMTAENMARHRHSQNFEFWKMLKTGYDHFELTKRPPEVNVCDRKYVFNQQTQGGSFNATAACPAMSTPPALASALASYDKTYTTAYQAALDKYEGMAWYDPSEAERKALVADRRKGRELAYAPTGSALKAGKMVKEDELEALQNRAATARASLQATRQPGSAALPRTATASPLTVTPTTLPLPAAAAPAVPPQQTAVNAAGPVATAPVPERNPLLTDSAVSDDPAKKKPFWKLWSSE